MKNIFIKTLSFLTILVGCTSSSKDIPSNVDNKKSSNHINVPNTKIFIIPPKEFKYSSDISGFELGRVAMIQVFNDFYKDKINTSQFNENKFNNKDADVIEYKEFNLNGYSAKFNHVHRDNKIDEYNLLFGDSTFSALLMAICPIAKPELGEEIKKSLLTAFYDKSLSVDPFQSASFSMVDTNSKFKFVKCLAVAYYYSIDGIDNLNRPEEPRIVIMNIPNKGSQTPKTVSEETILALKEHGFKISKFIQETDKPINGYQSYYIHVEGTVNNEPTTIFFQTIFSTKNAVQVQGVYPGKVSVDQKDFIELCSNIKIK